MANLLRLPYLHHFIRREDVYNNRPHNRNNHHRRNHHKEVKIDPEILRFYDSNGKVKPEAYDTNAQEISKIFANSPRETNTYTQLRHFYDEVVSLNEKIEEDPSSFDELLPIIKMLNAKAAYAEGRRKVSKEFVTFISESLKQIKTAKDMKTFKTFFEAVMGFYKATDKGRRS